MDGPRHLDVTAGAPVGATFFRRRSVDVARDLVGTLLLLDREGEPPVGGVVTETEAYVGHVDPACHLAAGRTPRTEPFFTGPGTVYVYTIYGHDNLNVITRHRGHPEGVLIRAVEPTDGIQRMRENRGFDDPTDLTTGPGRLTEAVGVTRAAFDGRPLAETALEIRRTDVDRELAVAPRIGISEAENWPLRFCLAGSPYLSKPVPGDGALDPDAVDEAYAELEATEAPWADSG